jgi:DNA polymerase bacteriophage-type
MDIVFADSETRSRVDVTVVGALPYAKHKSTDAVVWGLALNDEPSTVWSPAEYWGQAHGNRADLIPDRYLDAIANGAYFVAWNAFFDRHIWNEVMHKHYGWPYLKLEQVLCAQAQAEANNLPGKLDAACKALGTSHKKNPRGAALIRQLSNGNGIWDSERFETPASMGSFRAYCRDDVESMRDVWQHTRPLTLDEWAEYHASERINDRGVGIDVEFAHAAQAYAQAEFDDLDKDLYRLTDDIRLTITNHVRKARWLHDQLEPYSDELAELVRRPPKDGKDRFSADRSTRDAVSDLLVAPDFASLFPKDKHTLILEVLECIEAGNSAAVRKFTAMCNQEIDGRVHGQYSFNGAGQTGRFSSRGIQIHNLIRSPLDKKNPDLALDAMDDILDGVAPDTLVDTYGFPISRLLARLIRPSFVAAPGKTFVWADYAQVEARVLPWLSQSHGGNDKLQLFASGQDVYKHAAADIFGGRPDDIDDNERQVGKVAELALGFGGAVGAFMAMGRGYGVVISEEDALEIVIAWRKANAWCTTFWDQLWESAVNAYENPGTWFPAGRVKYLYHPTLMRGTLVCALPDERWIVYPQFKRERVIVEDEDGKERTKLRTSFVKGFAGNAVRVDLWHGMLAENITQGFAGSLLRRALRELDDIAVLHTHDEIVTEVDDEVIGAASTRLHAAMLEQPFIEGLPLSIDVEHGPYYTK